MIRPTRILVVDDNELFAETVARMLQRQGVEVATAFDGVHALERAMAQSYDLAIIDLIMPKMDGFELIRHLCHLVVPPRIIAMSGNLSAEGPVSLRSAIEMGANAILEKPFPQELLFERVFRTIATVERKPVKPSPHRTRLFA